MKERTLIQKYSSSIIRGALENIEALKDLKHKSTKGQLRELFVSNVLNFFIPKQCGIGTGIIINQNGDQSNQTDIIIYDERIIPPFIKERSIGVYPVESVLATIEVKSVLEKRGILEAEESAKKLYETVVKTGFGSMYAQSESMPLYSIIGFSGCGLTDLSDKESGREWLNKNIAYLSGICHTKKYSWIHIKDTTESSKWNIQLFNEDTREETKRFIAIIIDNVNRISIHRYGLMSSLGSQLGKYIRDWK